MPEIDTSKLYMPFGKYKGEKLTRVPIYYLEKIINQGWPYAETAQAELDRRGHIINSGDKIEITNHAIDRASLRVLGLYLAEHKRNEGLHAWLTRVIIEALEIIDVENEPDEFRITFNDMVLVMQKGELYPTLITVMKPGYEKED